MHFSEDASDGPLLDGPGSGVEDLFRLATNAMSPIRRLQNRPVCGCCLGPTRPRVVSVAQSAFQMIRFRGHGTVRGVQPHALPPFCTPRPLCRADAILGTLQLSSQLDGYEFPASDIIPYHQFPTGICKLSRGKSTATLLEGLGG